MIDSLPALFLFVHGSHTGAWIWESVRAECRSCNVATGAVDLAGYGSNRHVSVSLAAHANIVVDAISSCDRPVILVGHSMGGFVITQAASMLPERVSGLVYLAAFVPCAGETLADCASRDGASLVPKVRRVDPTGKYALIAEGSIGAVFFADAGGAQQRGWTGRFVADPLLSATEGCRVDRAVADIPASYIECERSKAVTIGFQREMQGRRKFDQVFTLNSGHMPMLEQPRSLVETLLRCSGFGPTIIKTREENNETSPVYRDDRGMLCSARRHNQ